MIQDSPGMLVPPRPNLGPEPWTTVEPRWWPVVVLGLTAFLLLLAGAWWIIRLRARGRKESAPQGPPAVLDDSPEARLLTIAGQARESLATRFGPSIRARTTEELSTDRAVQEALGSDQFETLIRLLSLADRWKFAPPPENGQAESLLSDLPQWSDWERSISVGTPGKRTASGR